MTKIKIKESYSDVWGNNMHEGDLGIVYGYIKNMKEIPCGVIRDTRGNLKLIPINLIQVIDQKTLIIIEN